VATDVAGLCPHCGRATDDRHACHDREVADLPLGGWKTQLVVRAWQFRCDGCGKFFTPRHPALAEGAHATERFLARLADLATHADVSAAARFFGIPEKTAERWYYDHLERRPGTAPASDVEPVRSLGIDELSTKKGTAGSPAC
jgi:transposase